jgi:WD repeat-containing protein 48
MKCSFYLIPAPGMQAISQGKLSAPRILRAQKVMNYVAQRLGLIDEKAVGDAARGQDLVQITCNDHVLQPQDSLATVRKYYWKKSDDVELVYKSLA